MGVSWVRNRISGTSAASPFFLSHNIAAVADGQTVRRSIVTFDWWLDSTTTLFVDAPLTVNYGISISTSNTAMLTTPWTDASTTGERWVYWDQLETRPIYTYDLSGTVYYLAKNGDGSRYLDTRIQYKNSTGAARYLWFGVEPDPGNVANVADTYWTMSSSVLIETP